MKPEPLSPDEIYDKITKGKEEVVVKLNDTPYIDTRGCKHYWIQLSGRKAQCKKCGLGTWGIVDNGKIVI